MFSIIPLPPAEDAPPHKNPAEKWVEDSPRPPRHEHWQIKCCKCGVLWEALQSQAAVRRAHRAIGASPRVLRMSREVGAVDFVLCAPRSGAKAAIARNSYRSPRGIWYATGSIYRTALAMRKHGARQSRNKRTSARVGRRTAPRANWRRTVLVVTCDFGTPIGRTSLY